MENWLMLHRVQTREPLARFMLILRSNIRWWVTRKPTRRGRIMIHYLVRSRHFLVSNLMTNWIPAFFSSVMNTQRLYLVNIHVEPETQQFSVFLSCFRYFFFHLSNRTLIIEDYWSNADLTFGDSWLYVKNDLDCSLRRFLANYLRIHI